MWQLPQANGRLHLVDTTPDPDGTVRVVRRQTDGMGGTELLCEILPRHEAALTGETLHQLHAMSCAATPTRKPNPMPDHIRSLLISRGHLSPPLNETESQ